MTPRLVPEWLNKLCADAATSEVQVVTIDKNQDRERSIDENLRRVFDETLEQGVPDRFKDLLSQLKEQDSKQSRAE